MAQHAIFIGYRREDTADVAGRIYDAMTRRFGRRRIFKDVDNLRPGADFGDYIKTVLPQCRVFLALIGPGWVESKDEYGARRLDDPHDWVRSEIEIALATPGLDVVPVLVNGARMPRPEELPDSMRGLLRRHAASIRRDPDFHDDVNRLATALKASVRSGVIDGAALGGHRRPAAVEPENAPHRSGLLALGVVVAMLAAGVVFVLNMLGPRVDGVAIPVAREAPVRAAPPPSTSALNDAPAAAPASQPASTVSAAREPEMVLIQAGSFLMGSPGDEYYRDSYEDDTPGDGGTQPRIGVRSFFISKFEITFEEWDQCVTAGGCEGYLARDGGWGRGNQPAMNVSWNDANEYAKWLSTATRKSYRLPSEAEWEYAARAGSGYTYWWGDIASRQHANFGAEECCEGYSSGRDRWEGPAPVGRFVSNPWGIHDMNGNVAEWVQDCASNAIGAAAVQDCSKRVLRGGSWLSTPTLLRTAGRDFESPTFRTATVGFRLARAR